MRALILAATMGLASWAANAEALEFVVANHDQARAAITTDDELVEAMSPADISIRLRKPDGGTKAEIIANYAAGVLDWNDAERARLNAMLARWTPRFAWLEPWLPATVTLVKNSDDIDGGLPHTRGTAIYFGSELPDSDAELDEVFTHELFHVLSRANRDRQDDLYALIGFVRCRGYALPSSIAARLLTNPDAPFITHAAPWAEGYLTPVLIIDPARYTPEKPRFTDYMSLQFLALTRRADGSCATAVQNGAPRMLPGETAVPAIMAAAGPTSNYIIHPEELMASNFQQMMTAPAGAELPPVQARLKDLLSHAPR